MMFEIQILRLIFLVVVCGCFSYEYVVLLYLVHLSFNISITSCAWYIMQCVYCACILFMFI